MEHGGIDVHKTESQTCLQPEQGEILEPRILSRRDRFAAVFGNRPRARLLIEASTESEWVARCLEELGHEVVVADPNYAPMYATRSRRVKTDALLATIPEIASYRSLLLAAELSPLSRFPRVEHLASYAGLAPVTRSSGGHTRHGSIPQGANREPRLRAADGAARVAGRAGGRRAEVAPHRLHHATAR